MFRFDWTSCVFPFIQCLQTWPLIVSPTDCSQTANICAHPQQGQQYPSLVQTWSSLHYLSLGLLLSAFGFTCRSTHGYRCHGCSVVHDLVVNHLQIDIMHYIRFRTLVSILCLSPNCSFSDQIHYCRRGGIGSTLRCPHLYLLLMEVFICLDRLCRLGESIAVPPTACASESRLREP